ncbi:MAG TPA: cysteine--tRNA ligase [Aestuariivirgaceae bacterium]|nr:cysteine--tRNA ligase [Aestuariivirgaceae bacterium]
MTLRLYNTLTRRKEDFRPLDAGNVRVYVCGPTVYDFAHIGNARPVVVFDVLFRLLRHLYPRVTYVRNITDVDDKINARAARDFPDLPLNEAIGRVTEGTLRQFHADVAALGCLTAEQVNKLGKEEVFLEPRATEHIEDMKVMIERLVENNCAYVEQDHVLFQVAAMPDYGVLANRSLDEMLAGARIEVAPYKRDAMDFVLWKPSSPGEPAWPAPCGIETPGRPGWHIECSAMSWRHLGETFDIHGGGIDLMFPHHENELAQSRCALGVERMASVWMHNGFLQVEGRKMAKSEGNFVTIRELLNTESFGGRIWTGDALRLAMLQTHYRKPIDWTVSALKSAESRFIEWADIKKDLEESQHVPSESADFPADERVLAALSDDLNTPLALSRLHRLGEKAAEDHEAGQAFLSSLRLLGFEGWSAEQDQRSSKLQALAPEVETLIATRNEARRAKNFGEADRIRDELAEMGIELHDTKDGTSWEVRR